jgi:hypothetical protein
MELKHVQKWKRRYTLLPIEMDYVRRSARISGMDRIRNERIRREIGMKKVILH